jgi:hypothetical protein
MGKGGHCHYTQFLLVKGHCLVIETMEPRECTKYVGKSLQICMYETLHVWLKEWYWTYLHTLAPIWDQSYLVMGRFINLERIKGKNKWIGIHLGYLAYKAS